MKIFLFTQKYEIKAIIKILIKNKNPKSSILNKPLISIFIIIIIIVSLHSFLISKKIIKTLFLKNLFPH